MRKLGSRLAIIGLLILLGIGVALGVQPDERAIQVPSIRSKTADERRTTLWALQDAWDNRLTPYSPKNQREERAFLNRLALFLRASQGREVFGEACRFWNRAYREHSSRYDDFIEAEN
jgi:hypothetical protein